MEAFCLLVVGCLGVAQPTVGDIQRAVGGAGGNLGALPANGCFLLVSGWDWGLGAGGKFGSTACCMDVFGLLVVSCLGGCPANGGRQAAGSWGRKGDLGALPANGCFLLASS